MAVSHELCIKRLVNCGSEDCPVSDCGLHWELHEQNQECPHLFFWFRSVKFFVFKKYIAICRDCGHIEEG